MTPLWKSTKDVDSHRALEKPAGFPTFPHKARRRSQSTNNLGVGQYCSIKVGQFYIVKKKRATTRLVLVAIGHQ